MLTRYGRLSPTTRVRFLQFIEPLERAGNVDLEFDVAPQLEDARLQRFYDQGTRRPAYHLKRYAQRARLLLGSGRYQLLWIEKGLFPGAPHWQSGPWPRWASSLWSTTTLPPIAGIATTRFGWCERF